ncbi:MAG: hypothetical protein JST54_15700 [Deltaproteobacteria bacterium]|nr:hypothetical protein [Deltaproteobacteria bacterium]
MRTRAAIALCTLLFAGAAAAEEAAPAATPATPADAVKLKPVRTGQDALAARLPGYPGAAPPTRVGDTMVAHGVPMNIQSFTTPDDPKKVLAYYEDVFEQLHLPTMGDGDLMVHFAYPSITAFDDALGVDLSVIAMRDTEHNLTTVILALADMQGLRDNVERALNDQFGGLPPYAGALAPHSLFAKDGEKNRVMVTFATSDVPEKVAAFYTAELGKQGFKPRAGAGPNELALASSNASWSFNLRRDDAKKQTVVMATWSSQVFEETGP